MHLSKVGNRAFWLLAIYPCEPAFSVVQQAKGRKLGDYQQDNRGIKFQRLTPRNPSIYWNAKKAEETESVEKASTTRRRTNWRKHGDRAAKPPGRSIWDKILTRTYVSSSRPTPVYLLPEHVCTDGTSAASMTSVLSSENTAAKRNDQRDSCDKTSHGVLSQSDCTLSQNVGYTAVGRGSIQWVERLSLPFYAADYAFETEQQGECSICTMFKKKDLQILRFNVNALLNDNQDNNTLLQDTVNNADNALFPAEKNLLRTY
ncbi:hypothetical protein T4E_11568 [Trichinella pseudospiralis]|uniref:Uncharacterized protein n=1 Tax=Trichinella pseudospiralis TaxID=6337 RepID=A0A0V0XZE4_TRIPS|nr:hypothetical protein T4E_11568 [Trichinella pseudospiralis]